MNELPLTCLASKEERFVRTYDAIMGTTGVASQSAYIMFDATHPSFESGIRSAHTQGGRSVSRRTSAVNGELSAD